MDDSQISNSKQTEQKNKELNIYYKSIIDTLREPFVILDTNLEVISSNEAFYLTFQETPQEIIGKSIYSLGNHQWDIPKLRELLEKILPNNNIFRNFEIEHDFKSIGHKIMLLNAQRLDSVQKILLAFEDITERKNLEKIVNKGLSKYQTLFLTSHDAIMTLEPPAWRFTTGNPATIAMFNAKDENDFISYEPWRLSPQFQPDGKKSADKALEMIQKAMRDGSNFFEWTHKRITGENFPANVLLSKVTDGKNAYLQAVVRDISDQKKMEEDLKDYEKEKFKVVFDNAIDGMLVADVKTKKFILANNAICQMLGYTKEEIKNLFVDDIHPKANLTFITTQFEKQSKNEISSAKNIPVKRKDGSIYYADINSSVIRIDGKKCILGIFRDISEHLLMENKLRTSEEFLRQIIDLVPHFIFAKDTNSRFLLVNKAVADAYGTNTKDILGKSDIDFSATPEQARHFHEDDLAVIQKGKPTFIPKELITDSQGNIRYLQTTKIPFKFGVNKTPGLLGVSTDITKQTIDEQNLRESEERFRNIFENGRFGIILTGSDQKFIGVNPAFCRMTGYTQKELLTKKFSDITHPNHVKQDIASVKKMINGEIPFYRTEKRYIKKNGEVIWVNLNVTIVKNLDGSFRYFLGMVEDITEHKQMEDKIIDDKLKDEAILASIGDAVFACDRSGNIVLFNRMAEKLSGLSAHDAIGQHYSQTLTFVKEIGETPIKDFISEALKENRITKMTNHTLLVKRDGSKIPIADSKAPIKNAEGKIIGCVVAFHDVTHEREIDKAKTEFVSLASHQLRTPLTIINWYTSLLSEEIDKLTPKQQEYLRGTREANKRMVNLVNALLNVSRLELGTFSVEPEKVSIQKIVKVCLQELAPLISTKKINLQETYDPDIPTVIADPRLLSIILSNLLSNAIKYTSNGGTVDLNVQKQKDTYLITVKDTGIGIPANQHDKIFTKLFRADNAKLLDPDGTGLGLYIVNSIVKGSGGKIWFESHTDGTGDKKGSIFYVSYPLVGMIKKAGIKQINNVI